MTLEEMSSSLAQIAGPSALDRALALVADNVEEAIADLAGAVAIDTSFPPGAGPTGACGRRPPAGRATRRTVTCP